MAELMLSSADARAVRALLGIDETAPDHQRWQDALDQVARLIPCDSLAVALADEAGCVLDAVDVSPGGAPVGRRLRGPFRLGFQHLTSLGPHRPRPDPVGARGSPDITDRIRIGFATTGGGVVQLALDRRSGFFDTREAGLLTMLEPALTRALVPHGRRRPLDRLTGAEREVLRLVSTGASNTAAARALCCSEATIRKHLEHTYRKLGVANRTAAAALLHEPSGV